MKPVQALSTWARRRRAAAHRAMAFSALRANSSTATRLSRYKHHMQRARALEAEANAASTWHLIMPAEGGAQ